jgi:serine/threonine protein kinase
MGYPPSPACDVWAVGVSVSTVTPSAIPGQTSMINSFQLAHFIAAKALFGCRDVNVRVSSVPMETSQAACSIAKIIRLIGPITRSEDPQFTAEFDLAEMIAQMEAFPTRSLEEELKTFGPEQDLIESIRWLLALDPEIRPTAKQALEHPWLQGLGRG